MGEKITRKPFCYWHIETQESTTTCTAHLNESRASECPYSEEDIHYSAVWGSKRIAHRSKEGNLIGFCEDFQPLEQIASAQSQPSCTQGNKPRVVAGILKERK